MYRPLARQLQLKADVLSWKSSAESEHVHLFSPVQGELMHLVVHNQSGLKNNNTFSVSALEMFFLIKLSHLHRACVVTITVFEGWKLIWIKTQLQSEGGEKIRRCLLYTETEKGRKKRGQGERAAWTGSLSLFCMHRGFCGRRSWQGAAVLPPALRQQLLRKRRRPEGAATCLALSPSLFSPVCLFLSASRHTLDTCATLCLPHTHGSLSQWHTRTSEHVGCEIHKKLAGCSNETLKINQV